MQVRGAQSARSGDHLARAFRFVSLVGRPLSRAHGAPRRRAPRTRRLRASLRFQQTEVPSLFWLAESSNGGFHAAQQLRRSGEHRRANTHGHPTRPVPHASRGDSFDTVNKLEGSAKPWREFDARFFHRQTCTAFLAGCKTRPARPRAYFAPKREPADRQVRQDVRDAPLHLSPASTSVVISSSRSARSAPWSWMNFVARVGSMGTRSGPIGPRMSPPTAKRSSSPFRHRRS